MSPPRLSFTPPGYTDVAMEPPHVLTDPGPAYAAVTRNWQGIPSVERAANGRLWVTWYTGGEQEDNDNYCLLVTSEDNGTTWSEPVAVINPQGMARAWDPNLWHDPSGRMWWWWTQTAPMRGEAWDGRGGVWAVTTSDSHSPRPTWTQPRRLFHGVALNKPMITSKGQWLMPLAIWKDFTHFTDLDPFRKPGVIASIDGGETWQWRGGAEMANRVFDEPMVVELRDGNLWMLLRSRHGINESFSMDGGISWSEARPSSFAGPSSRFHLRRLANGRLLFINHLGNPGRARSHLTAMLSEDDGKTWPYRLLLDERTAVSYPDAVESPDGHIYIVYDRDRYGEREILMAAIQQSDIVAGHSSSSTRLRILVNKASGPAQ